MEYKYREKKVKKMFDAPFIYKHVLDCIADVCVCVKAENWAFTGENNDVPYIFKGFTKFVFWLWKDWT